MSCPKKPAGLSRIKMTPTKRCAILMYQDECHRSFNWIANEAPLFQNTSANHTTISKAYDATQQHGCYYKLYLPGRPPVISEEDLDQGIADLDNSDATDGADPSGNGSSQSPIAQFAIHFVGVACWALFDVKRPRLTSVTLLNVLLLHGHGKNGQLQQVGISTGSCGQTSQNLLLQVDPMAFIGAVDIKGRIP
ncbi:hypothetical protein BT96DRAFT_996474 [Gymnopus androsaceus JB14]|uniref:Uncharacterized protein n=1 Tax=Gymnopus androsaceus JB14 TaxID=1447944 RepID=A0A6A4HGG1_9AGAR|nr:hypothetical protein BT96DRAFT_996474 [Gymnopus androsaceus JB14]